MSSETLRVKFSVVSALMKFISQSNDFIHYVVSFDALITNISCLNNLLE